MSLIFCEAADSRSISSGAFRTNGAKIIRRYYLQSTAGPLAPFDVQSQITNILGTTVDNGPQSSNGVINRVLPYADPQFPWCYATDVNYLGVDYFTETPAQASGPLEVSQIADFAFYNTAWFDITFEPRPYPLLQDHSINSYKTTYVSETNVSYPYTYFAEWNRFCDITLTPQFNFIQQQAGQMVFQANNGGSCGANGKQYKAMPRIALPDIIFEILWVGVPMRYIFSDNSYFTRDWVGRVNQDEFSTPTSPGFEPGELLWLGWKPVPYTPSIQSEIQIANGNVGYAPTKLMNITLTFLYTPRVLYDTVSPPPSSNYVVGGHNLLPWQDRHFHYAVTTTSSQECVSQAGTPSFLSFPLYAIFTDPDSPGALPFFTP